MQTVYEATHENVRRLAQQRGTYLLRCERLNGPLVRSLVYAMARAEGAKVHTILDQHANQMKVVFSEPDL